MAKSRRIQTTKLTKTAAKGRPGKESLVNQLRDALDSYSNVFVYSVKNMRNQHLKQIKHDLADSCKFFFGSNKVMAIALGNSPASEQRPNLHLIAKELSGNVGLLFSNSDSDRVREYLDSFTPREFARAGIIATETVTIPNGPVMRKSQVDQELVPFPHNMESQLRALRMPTRLVNGVVVLENDYTICNVGDCLNSEQAQLLKHFGVLMAEFRVKILFGWKEGDEELTQFEVDE